MTEEYDAASCNALELPFYTPVRAALRWCNLTFYEGEILQKLDPDNVPKPGQFPQWPCLQANTAKILDAIEHKEIPRGREGKPVPADEQVNRAKLTVRHTDLREWIMKFHPGNKPAFLFDEIERGTHQAISTAAYATLQAESNALGVRLENVTKRLADVSHNRDALSGERDSLAAIVQQFQIPDDRTKSAYLNVIGAMLDLLRNPRPGRDSDAAVIRELVGNYSDRYGISSSTLEKRFAEARRMLFST